MGIGAGAREITYPVGSEIVIDITQAPYFADSSGVQDVGPKIEAAVADALSQAGPAGAEAAPIVYFPNGRYRIATPVVLEAEQEGGQWQMLQGQSRDGVVLFSDDNASAFQDANFPVPLISYFEGNWTNNAFTNLFENFTVEIGAGNPGAIGVRFHGNNVARMENVRIVSMDPDGSGAIGLDLKPRISAPGLIKHVEVEGFDVGIDIANPTSSAQGWTLEHITVRNQNTAGVQSHRKAIQLLDFTSVNIVPAYISQFVDGMVTLIGADLSTPDGETSEGAAIIGNGDFLYLKDVSASGYANLLDDKGTLVAALQPGESYQNGPAYALWSESLADFAELPVIETPEIPWEDPSLWEIVDPQAQADDTEALQAALLSGAKTVFLLPGLFEITESVRVGPDVQRLASNWARIQWRGDLFESGHAIFYWEESNHDVVIMERIAANWWQNSKEYMLHNASEADLVLRDIFWAGGGIYRNDPTGGRLFIENCHNVPGGQVFRPDLPSWIIVNQETWARQFNPEMAWPLLTVDGGTFWVSGFKFGEQQGPVVIAKNQAVVEMLGGYMNVTHGVDLVPTDVPMIDIEEARVSVRLIERAAELDGPPTWNFRHRNVARETRNGETRLLPTKDPMIIHRDTMSRNGPGWGGAMVPLYTSLLDASQYPLNASPVIEAAVSVAATTQGGAQLFAKAVDPDGPASVPAIHWRKVAGPGAAYFSDAASASPHVVVSRPGNYSFVATASDGLSRTDSAPVGVQFTAESETFILSGSAMQRLTDLPPRDGEANSALGSIFLYAGDFSTSPSAQEMEIRLHMEADLRKWAGISGAIGSATLRLVPKSLRNPPQLDLVRTTTFDSGIVSVSDFSAQSQLVTQVDAATPQVGIALELDVTEAVKATLSDGRDAIGLQLRMSGGPNDDGASNYVEFFGSNPATPQNNPQLVIEPAEASAYTFSDRVALLQDGTGYAPGIGPVLQAEAGWWWSESLGRFFYPDPLPSGGDFHLYLTGLGWLWTGAGTFPFMYQYSTGSWMYALTDETAFWFHDLSAGQWLWSSPDGTIIFP